MLRRPLDVSPLSNASADAPGSSANGAGGVAFAPGEPLRRHTVTTLAEFQALRDEYAALVASGDRKLSPFVTHRWLSAFWLAYAARYQGRMLCLYARDTLVAAVPLMYGKDVVAHVAMRRVSFLGGDWGWNEFPMRADATAAAAGWANELLSWLFAEERGSWSLLQLGPMHADAAATGQILRALDGRGVAYKTIGHSGPYLPLPARWDEFLAGRSRNFRRTIKRKEAAAAEAGITVRRFVDPTPDELRATVFDVSERSWQGARGLAVASTAEGRRFYELLVTGGGEMSVELTAAFHGDRCVGYLLGLTRGPVYHAFDTGFDPAYAEQSPGLLVHFAAMRALFGTGVEEFNLGFAHSYKERFEPESHPAVEVQLFRTRISGAFGALVDQAKRVLDRG
jgi:CelD/BcsL family acetyltransferase involved in cellulose biosynthesis